MIKAGISGGECEEAGRLIGLLTVHPDVELIRVMSSSEGNNGLKVSNVHHGLVGETDILFSEPGLTDDIDVLFNCNGQLSSTECHKELRVIDMSGCDIPAEIATDFVYGLPELNRKRIVRGCRRVTIPSPAAMAIGLPLIPLAKNYLLDGDVTINIESSINDLTVDSVRDEIAAAFVQSSVILPENIYMQHVPSADGSGIRVEVKSKSKKTVDEIIRVYNEFYDDHNFVFTTEDFIPEIKDVINTNKCLIHIGKTDNDNIVVTSVIDRRLKGGSGCAVHNMNLLFGLSEKTGLSLVVL